MINCSEFREAMMVAELSELRGQNDSALAMHMRGCAACRAHARAIVQSYAALDEGLSAVRVRRPDVIPLRGRRMKWMSLPLAAAAVLALLMVPRVDDQPPPPMEAITRLLFPEEAVVTPSEGQQALVLEKPEMTIVWLYNEEAR